MVNLPVMIAAPSGWATFYVFSKDRGADWGSVWYMFEYFNLPGLGDYQLSVLNEMSAAALIAAFAAIALLALAAPRRPRLPQLCFLLLAAFLMTNKVWSPQYVIWLVPLAVLARPRLWPYAAVAARRDRLLLRHLGLPDLRTVAAPGHRLRGISTGWYFALLAGQVPHRRPARRLRGAGHPLSERDVVRARGHRRPGRGRPGRSARPPGHPAGGRDRDTADGHGREPAAG